MKTSTMLGVAAMTAILAITHFPSSGAAQALSPSIGTFTNEDLERAYQNSAEAPLSTDPGWEDTEKAYTEEQVRDVTLLSTDDDTCHYNRGMTLIVHIFVNHDGGTWDGSERADAAARATVAKQYYIDNAPAGANVHFDNEDGNQYWYLETTVSEYIPDSGMTSDLMETVCGLLGRTDVDGDGWIIDDFTLEMQNWNGGWDNVIFCFEPDQTGRAWASSSFARTALYTDSAGNVFAHEWGHLFGACDEYVEAGTCNGGVNCGACQSTYLDDVINNGNCELGSCPSDVDCLMRHNTLDNICDYTLNHWGWVDEDNDGYLDYTKRRTTGNNFVLAYNIPHNGYALGNTTTDGYVIAQQWNSWCVAGLRSPGSADYDLDMYGDNSHNYLQASSAAGLGVVDFVVSDYNHSRIGNEHLQVRRYSGDTANYRLNWESGTGVLYPDGIERTGNWYSFQTVRAFEAPLFAGETITFDLDVNSGNTNFGMALFRSYGEPYYAARSSAQWIADDNGNGLGESYTWTVPADDVYGLILFANNAADATFDIQIGPAPATLAEEAPYHSGLDLRLYNYNPNDYYWSFAGTRPESGTNVAVRLFQDSAYRTHLATSDDYAGIEFIAADYNPDYSTDYLRVNRTGGSGTHTTEWEHGADILSGVHYGTWDAGHVGKVWDAYLQGGQQYFLRNYESGGSLDTGLYLFGSGDGDRYKQRAQAARASNGNPPEEGGEWFSYTPSTTDWYGIYQIVNDESSGGYSLWLGPQFATTDDAKVTRSDEVIWNSMTATSYYWAAYGVRPTGTDAANLWLYGDSAYNSESFKTGASVFTGGVAFVVADFNHTPLGNYYPAFWRSGGTGDLDIEWEIGTEYLSFTTGGVDIEETTWPAGDVVETIELWVPGGVGSGADAIVTVDDQSGVMDLGVALFGSNAATFFGRPADALALVDDGGVGDDESFTYHFSRNDFYALVIYNKNDSGGAYSVSVLDQAATDAPDASVPVYLDLSAASSNPFKESATLRFGLPKNLRVDLLVFDATGRQVRSLVSGPKSAGFHTAVWDGRDERGVKLPAGIYFARLSTLDGERNVKLVRAQ